jgi:hypothetical protein
MTTKTRREPSAKFKTSNIRIRRSPKVVRAVFWVQTSGRSAYNCTLNYDGGHGKIRTYRVGSEDGRTLALEPLEIWTERQLMLLIFRAVHKGKTGEIALVPVELLQRVLGYSPKEFADPV